jgi:hypothetical protein
VDAAAYRRAIGAERLAARVVQLGAFKGQLAGNLTPHEAHLASRREAAAIAYAHHNASTYTRSISAERIAAGVIQIPTDPAAAEKGAVSSDCTDSYPCVQPAFYALDTLLPVVDLGANGHWAPNGDTGSGRAARNTAVALALNGWLIGGLTVIGASERLRDPT